MVTDDGGGLVNFFSMAPGISNLLYGIGFSGAGNSLEQFSGTSDH